MKSDNTAVLLLVEGDDEEFLVKRMCEKWFPKDVHQIIIENVHGKENFGKQFRALRLRSLGITKIIGVIADSEENPAATAQRWTDLFNSIAPQINLPCKKLQLPSDTEAGAFEALVLNALDGDSLATCAKGFRDCAKQYLENPTLAQQDKIAVQAWLSAKLGQAYGNVFKAQNYADKKNPPIQLLDYDHPAFTSIKTFIADLLTHKE